MKSAKRRKTRTVELLGRHPGRLRRWRSRSLVVIGGVLLIGTLAIVVGAATERRASKPLGEDEIRSMVSALRDRQAAGDRQRRSKKPGRARRKAKADARTRVEKMERDYLQFLENKSQDLDEQVIDRARRAPIVGAREVRERSLNVKGRVSRGRSSRRRNK